MLGGETSHGWCSWVLPWQVEAFIIVTDLKVLPSAHNNPDVTCKVPNSARDSNGGKETVQAWLYVAIPVPVV